jgi:lipid-A-disaccharide synthase
VTLVYIIAGEASGDVLGARLIAALRRRRPDLTFAGVGGPLMAEQGVTSLFPMREIALMGFVEVLPRVLHVRRRIAQTIADITHRHPAVVVTIDIPGFATRVLRGIGSLGILRVHYVAPTVWAWRPGRVRRYPGLFDDLLCLLPFEPEFFHAHGVPARFVGHPVLESGADRGNAASFRARHDVPADARLLTVMPGSRRSEIKLLLPPFGEAIRQLSAVIPGLLPVIPLASPVAEAVHAATSGWTPRPILVTDEADKYDAFAASEAALVKSGTSTLEVAMAGKPMVVAYRANWLSAIIVRRLVRVRFASILNLLPDREIVPELIQEEVTPERIVATLLPLLTDPEAARAQCDAYAAQLARLRPPHGLPSDAAAEAVLSLLAQDQGAPSSREEAPR